MSIGAKKESFIKKTFKRIGLRAKFSAKKVKNFSA
jgi:hypothetical protein